MAQTFALQPIGRTARVTLYGLTALNIVLAVLVALTVDVAAHPLVMWFAILSTVAIAGLFAWFAMAQRHSSVTIGEHEVVVRVPLYGRSIPLSRLDAASVSKVSLPADAKFRLTWRTNGLGVPGYQLGWFKTQGAGSMLAALSSDNAVTWQTADAYGVLLSVADGDGFVAALKGACARVG